MDMHELYAKAGDWTSGVFDKVGADQHAGSTPCAEWNVKTLMDHVVGTNHWMAATLAGEQLPDTHDGEQPDLIGDDAGAAYRASFEAASSAFAAPGVFDQAFQVGTNEMTGKVLMSIAISEAMLHGWDLARATGQDENFDPDVAQAVYQLVEPGVERGRASGAYGDAVAVSNDASAQDRLLGITGRRP